jgi:hypothetical protein
MGSYMRLGSFLLADELADLPYGKLHRALTTAGRNLDRHCLLFTFSDELLKAGLSSRWPEAQRLAAQLAGNRGFGSGYRLDPGKPAHLTCDYLPGRTLAQVLEKVKEEQAPLGVEHALMVLQGLAQAVIQMHERGLRHGALSPHSAWVSYEGAALILDAPVGTALQATLPGAPALKAALEPYQCAAPASPFQQDLFSLGAILFEMLTLEPPPGAPGLAAALDQATLRAAQEEAALPGDLLGFLKRLLMVGQPFAGAPEFNGALERVLYDGEYSPTTFSTAFLMHTLFRDELEADAMALQRDQGADFTPFLAPEGAAQAPPQAARSSNRPVYLLLGGIAVVVAAGFGFMYYRMRQSENERLVEARSTQARLAAIQRDKEAAEAKLAEIAKQEEAQKTLEELFGKQAEEAATQEAREAARRDLEAAKRKRGDLARQKAEALRKLGQPGAGGGPADPGAGDLDTPPVATQVTSPQLPKGGAQALPPALRQADLKVFLKVLVDASGHPQQAVVVKGVEGNYGYNDAAQNAALASTYTPGMKNGKPASGWLNLEFDFGMPK